MTDPARLLTAASPGSCIHARVALGAGSPMETALLLRETSARIAALGPGPRVVIRVGLIEQDGVGLVSLLLRLGPEREDGSDVWECWINACAEGDHALSDLARQKRVVVLLYGDRPGSLLWHERAIASPNALRADFRRIAEAVATLRPWGMAQFDAAREAVYSRYSTPQALWEAMD